MEVISSGSQADGLQQRVTGQKKLRRGSGATHRSVMVEEQTLGQAEAPKEALTQTTGQTLAQNSDKLLLRRQDIVNVPQE